MTVINYYNISGNVMRAAGLFLLLALMATVQADDYEQPLVVSAQDVVPKELFKSDLYTIDDQVITRGYTNTYKIKSDYGDFTAHGNAMLAKQVQEIKAIHELAEVKKSKKFGTGIKEGVKLPFTFVKNLVTHPVSTVSGVPKGLWRYASRVGEMTTEKKSEYEDGFGKELILFSEQKRQLAFDLNVDVYSSNKVLQEHLNSVSWASYAGGVVVTVGLKPIAVLSYTKAAQQVDGLIRDNAPEDLNKINRKVLEELSVKHDVIKAFQANVWISPRHETEIVHALQYMGIKSGVGDFIRLASSAESEEDAFFFQNIAKLMLHYLDNTVESDTHIVIKDNFALLKVRKHFVFPLLVDNGYWSQVGANLMDTFVTDLRLENGKDTQLLLWITGDVSERGKEELHKRNILLVEQAYKTVGKDI